MSTRNNELVDNEQAAALSSAAVARRRILLKGVGKGAAVLAATVPIQTLANQTLLTPDGLHQCSISGMTSGVHSATPTNTARCGGFSPGYWGAVKPSTKPPEPLNLWPYNYNELLKVNFPRASAPSNVTLFDVMRDPTYATIPERHWIAACLNALKLNAGGGFPYTASEVLGFYNQGAASRTYQNALTFFTNYMETRT